MTIVITDIIKKTKDEKGLNIARDKYFAYFVVCQRIYRKYKNEVNRLLIQDGYEDCIVE